MTSDVELLAEAKRLLEKGTRVALCTIIEKKGSGPRGVGTKMIVGEDGMIYGTIGGGSIEKALIEECTKVLQERQARTIRFNLTGKEGEGMISTGLICGGESTVFVDVLEADPRLIIVGSGHVALPLARLANIVGFNVTIIDNDALRANGEHSPAAKTIITSNFADAINELQVSSHDVVVIAHGDPECDYIALKAIVEKKPDYVGLLGSKSKVAHLMQRLESDGMRVEDPTMLHAPVGLAIGAQTPEEIAISILAEIIQHLRGKNKQRS